MDIKNFIFLYFSNFWCLSDVMKSLNAVDVFKSCVKGNNCSKSEVVENSFLWLKTSALTKYQEEVFTESEC